MSSGFIMNSVLKESQQQEAHEIGVFPNKTFSKAQPGFLGPSEQWLQL